MTDHAARTTVEADVLEREVIDESLLRRLLQRAGTDLQTTADGSKREREGRDEGRKRY